MKTILLTGATGFVGSHLLRYLIKKKYKIIVLKRSTSDISRITNIISDVMTYDVDKVPIELAFKDHKIEGVIHLATFYGWKQDYENSIKTNIIFGLNLISLAIKYKIDIFINTDTFWNSKNLPKSHLAEYVLTKKHFLEWLSLKAHSIKIANMKIHHVYGENDSDDKFSMWLFNQLNNGNKKIKLTSGTQLRDFIYIQDIITAYEVVILNTQKFNSIQEFNVSTGNKHTIKEFCNVMGQEILKDSNKVNKVLFFGAKNDNPNEIMDVDNNNSPLLKLGWKPKFDLVNGIQSMVANMKI